MSSKAVLGLSAELNAPTSAYAGDSINIIFGSDDPTATNELMIDGTLITSATPHVWQTSIGDTGIHSLLVTATALARNYIGESMGSLIKMATIITFMVSTYVVVLRYDTPISMNAGTRRDKYEI